MSAAIIAIADTVVEALNSASLSQSFEAERFYVPVHSIEDCELHVTVVPATLDDELLDRNGRVLTTFAIDVAVQKVIGAGQMTNDDIKAACDPLMQLAQEIAELFRTQQISDPPARCIKVRNVPIFAPDHLDEKRVFTSLLSLEFKLGR